MNRPADLSVRVVASKPDGVEAIVFLDPQFAGFDGHFPGAPVLPAMCHVDLALRVAANALGAPYDVDGIEHARFVRKATPGQDMQVKLTVVAGDGAMKTISALHSIGGKIAVEMRLRVTPRGTASRLRA